jgi:L-2-hydroxyglutarate oxidase LhgO
MTNLSTDFLIIGAGIIGLTIAKELKEKYPDASIVLIEKEKDVAQHSSGRNSGVLHAGFYYSKDSLKAKFTKEGNEAWRNYCYQNDLKIFESKKVVVATCEEELEGIYELEKRGRINQVHLKLIDEQELKEIEPNAKTYQKALYSPLTATVDPVEICQHIKNQLLKQQVKIYFEEPFIKKEKQIIRTKSYKIQAKKIINCAGLYADQVAKAFGFSKDYVIIPFKGIYLKYTGRDQPIRTNIYPVPNLRNPFLGVHFTITVNHEIKIGPTAIPAFWIENYQGIKNIKPQEFFSIVQKEMQLFFTNAFDFRRLAFEEIRKYNRKHFIQLAAKLVHQIDFSKFNEWSKPGIRAQLLNLKTNELVQDFIIEGDDTSIHILNAVSPAFTAAIPFTKYVIEKYIKSY